MRPALREVPPINCRDPGQSGLGRERPEPLQSVGHVCWTVKKHTTVGERSPPKEKSWQKMLGNVSYAHPLHYQQYQQGRGDPIRFKQGTFPWKNAPPLLPVPVAGDALNLSDQQRGGVHELPALVGDVPLTDPPWPDAVERPHWRVLAGIADVLEDLLRAQRHASSGPGQLSQFPRDRRARASSLLARPGARAHRQRPAAPAGYRPRR